eukprot:TRINITY_DN3074_c0_g2_i1.p1 TRINITY_DN3074_c0_g2~~TRINITY_DN3074_c0_g2_i1.p1  ORF type:complete len:374 (+),score=-23.04 TRINITY_DN3074_c0_g2_i1:408-1529(+)
MYAVSSERYSTELCLSTGGTHVTILPPMLISMLLTGCKSDFESPHAYVSYTSTLSVSMIMRNISCLCAFMLAISCALCEDYGDLTFQELAALPCRLKLHDTFTAVNGGRRTRFTVDFYDLSILTDGSLCVKFVTSTDAEYKITRHGSSYKCGPNSMVGSVTPTELSASEQATAFYTIGAWIGCVAFELIDAADLDCKRNNNRIRKISVEPGHGSTAIFYRVVSRSLGSVYTGNSFALPIYNKGVLRFRHFSFAQPSLDEAIRVAPALPVTDGLVALMREAFTTKLHNTDQRFDGMIAMIRRPTLRDTILAFEGLQGDATVANKDYCDMYESIVHPFWEDVGRAKTLPEYTHFVGQVQEAYCCEGSISKKRRRR